MEFKIFKTLPKKYVTQAHALWNAEYPTAMIQSDIKIFEQYLNNLANQSHILLIDEDDLLGWYFDYEQKDLTWFSMILKNEIHSQGYGTKILKMAKTAKKELNGWVITSKTSKKTNGQIYRSPLKFYKKQDFKILVEKQIEVQGMTLVAIRWTDKS